MLVYLAVIAAFGIYMSGKQSNTKDYYLGDRNLPWWAVCLSVVATESSALTVISVPAIAYLGSFTFLQLALGYFVGRILVAFVLLPRYYQGELTTAYTFLGQRFGGWMQTTTGVTFLITRLLADGVRLFATAIPIKVILDGYGMNVSYWQIITVVAIVTVIYTYIGGIRSVVWVDTVQMGLYFAGGLIAIAFLAGGLPEGFFAQATEAGKTQLFDLASNPLTNPYSLFTAVVGGAMLGMASHGADQIVVQRLLACRTLADGQKAVIGSAVVVGIQFAVFLVVGLLLWGYYNAQDPEGLGLTRADEVFPLFIIEGLPAGLSGLLLVGIVSAAMSTLSSSLNALSSSTLVDLYERFSGRSLSDEAGLRLARIFTLVWAGVFIIFANLFENTDNPVVELGLGIAGLTYGALLGAFLLGLLVRRARQSDAIIAFGVTILTMIYVVFWTPLAFPLYTVIGVVVTLVVGGLLSLRHSGPDPNAGPTGSQPEDQS
ncbi:MAG: sodium:solute symporter [Rubrobacteraceae bacterium]